MFDFLNTMRLILLKCKSIWLFPAVVPFISLLISHYTFCVSRKTLKNHGFVKKTKVLMFFEPSHVIHLRVPVFRHRFTNLQTDGAVNHVSWHIANGISGYIDTSALQKLLGNLLIYLIRDANKWQQYFVWHIVIVLNMTSHYIYELY